MKSKVICMASPKGGSGKTIITANFSTFLSKINKKCLIIDCDLATHGLSLLYLNQINNHIANLEKKDLSGIFDNVEIKKRDIISLDKNLDFLPATYTFGLIEEDEKNFYEKLKTLLSKVEMEYDYIFLDAQAGSDLISRVAMKKEISDEVIIVSEYDPLSAAGIERLKSVLSGELEHTRTWILLNKMLPEFVEKFSDFLSVARYLSPIPWTSEVVKAYSRKQLAIDTKYGNEYTLSIIQSLKTLLGGKISNEIDKWAEKKASNIREPLEIQYDDAEKELSFLVNEKLKIRRNKRIRSFFLSALIGIVLLIFTFIVTDQATILSHIFNINIVLEPSGIGMTTLSMVFMVLTLYVFSKFQDASTSKERIEESRIQRKSEVLEEKLKKLEALKKADYKTLIKDNN